MSKTKKIKLPRGKMPPPTKKFVNKKKEADKKACRKFDKEEGE